MENTLAFQLFTLKDFEGGWSAAFDAVRSMGIDTIEVWSGAVPDNAEGTLSLSGLRDALNEKKMKLACGHLSIGEFETRYEEWKNLLIEGGSADWVIPFAKADTLDEWLALLPTFRKMSERLHTDGLKLGYHNHSMELVKMGDKYVMEHLLDSMPELKAQFHIGQFIPSRGISLIDWLKKYEGRVNSLHVNDAGTDGHVRLGKGVCNVEGVIKTALDTGVRIFIVEIMLTKDNFDDIQRDVEFARNLIT